MHCVGHAAGVGGVALDVLGPRKSGLPRVPVGVPTVTMTTSVSASTV